jgi:hypothetical protein
VGGIVLAAVLVAWFLRRADLAAVAEHLRAADLRYVALACLTVGLTSLQRAWRWRRLLAPLGVFHVRDLWAAIAMGWTVSVLLPGRLGEIARPLLLSRRAAIDGSAALGSVVLERLFDVVTILCMLAAYLVLAPPPAALTADGATTLAALRSAGIALLATLLVAGILAMAAARSATTRERAEAAIERVLPGRLAVLLSSFLRGMSGLRSTTGVAGILISSAALWGTVLVTYVLLFRAMAIDVPWFGSIPLLTLLVIGAAVPTPAGVGAFHKVAQIGLVGLLGVPNEPAVAYAIVSHAVAFLPLAALGLLLLARAGLVTEVLAGIEGDAGAAK